MKKTNIGIGAEYGKIRRGQRWIGLWICMGIMWILMSGCAHRPEGKPTLTVPDAEPVTSALPETSNVQPELPVVVNAMDARGAVAVEIVPQYRELLSGIEGELPLLIRLDGKEVAQVARQPMNLAVVIDRSGSMSGDKIASVKVAAIELLKRLIPEDRVTLISYSDDVMVHSDRQLLTEVGIQLLRDEILRLTAGGSTALGPATLKAIEMLGTARGDGAVAGVSDTDEVLLSHVLLLSDGIANEGVTSPDILGQACADGFTRGISVSTLGVGLDYNEDLMTRMADEGGGQYHYVREESRIAAVLDDELRGLMATVARDIELEIKCSRGFQVKEVYGYAQTPTQMGTRIRVGALRSGQNRDILVMLGYAALSIVDAPMAVADVGLHFRDVTHPNSAETIFLAPMIQPTRNPAAATGSENTEVTVRLAEVRSLEQLKTVARAVNSGDFVQAEQVLVNSIATLEAQTQKTPDEKLNTQIQELQQARDNLELAKTSAAEQQHYVKQSKSTAYQKSKRTFGRKSTFEKMKAEKKSKISSKKPAPAKKKAAAADLLSY